MIRNDINILIGVKKATMRIAASCLLLFFLSGNALAQDYRYVIKKKVEPSDATAHYLAHVKNNEGVWVLQDATSFSPACLWISDNTYCPGGNNKNYYFYDDNNTPRFLASPVFQEGGALTLSTTVPSGSDLGTPEYQYYFYRWDSGLGRGVQYFGVTDQTCTHHWEWNQAHTDGECWEVYWVAYDAVSGTWKLSDMHYDLDDTPNGARYHDVTITEYTQDTTTLNNSGLTPLSGFPLEWEGSPQTISPSITTPYSYYFTPAYTEYVVNESYYGHEPNPINVQHNYWGGEDHGDEVPGQVDQSESRVVSLSWTITGDAAEYLSFSDVVGSNVTTSNADAPTLYYSTQNTTGDKTATLRLVVTYENGAKQTSMATVTVLTPCQNPAMIGAPEVTETEVTLSWYPTATSYMVSWQKAGASTWNSVGLGNVTSYTIRGLDFATTYYYKVRANSCTTDDPTPGSFTTLEEPEGLVLFGAVFGGGRMADVDGKTEVVIINASDINAVFGGNDIAGKVNDENGSTITLGVDADDPHDYDEYGTTDAAINIGSVYGGGNGYYAYNGSSFVPATDTYASHEVAANGHVNAMTQEHEVGEVVWTNTGTEPKTLEFPSIAKTNITVTNDFVKVDSLFGGAKNAFLTNETNDVNITINGGTLFTVFGGNNFGGTLGAGSQEHIVVNNTATETENYHSLQLGRDFGIGYLFGGGNKVEGRNVQIDILGGQMDTIFGGGNAADVLSTQLTVNCALAAGTSGPQFGKVFSEAITECSGESPNFTLTIDENYNWKCSGIYNVRTLFGGNNRADMEGGVPNLILTSGSIGTVYGGGNAGDMKDSEHTNINFDDFEPFGVDYSTHVVMNSPTMLVDYLYGGCQMSNVLYSTWVELQKGHVGTVYGGCNISGDVGSTRFYDPYPSGGNYPQNLEEQKVWGGTYVKAGGSDDANVIVYNNLIAGSNGYYDCSQDGIHYKGDSNFDDPTGKYDGLTVPTHNETHAIISDGATIKGNVYAGGNLACVGFDDGTGFYRGFPELIGLASLRMDGGTVNGNVYGGGNLASIYGINEVRVSGGTIGLALYGGNDCSGQVAEKTNRILPNDYTVASDNVTSLSALGVKTYVGVSGNPQINTVYGGGNGVYAPGEVEYCYSNFEPVQSYTFVDIHIDGGTNGGHIGTVYGGGNGVTVRHGVTVFLNVQGTNVEEDDNNHVDVVFGGNNKGDLNVVSDIILLHGKVGTVYGGCNQGAMIATDRVKTIGGYENIGSYVRLMDTYDPDGVPEHLETVTAKVTDAVYGGCRMNGVTNNSLVLVEGGNHSGISLYGGSDISGTVSGKSMVATVGGTVGNVYGGGNGGYYYGDYNPTTDTYSVYTNQGGQLLATGVGSAPSCNYSGVDIWSGQVGIDANHKGQVFGGGFGQLTSTDKDVEVNIGAIDAVEADPKPLIYGEIYGGSALGNVNFNSTHSTTVNFLNGTLVGSLYGGGLGDNNVEAKVKGKVFVNISSSTQDPEHCFIDLRNARVYGCNNTNGSPQDDVEVHVYKTGYTTGDYSPTGSLYAIKEVFGGGNRANYTASGKTAKVYVHGCLNTIERVFSGGNAASATGVAAEIDGGGFDYVFGGGNGEVSAADIGDGGTDLLVKGGIINHLFGGSNKTGSISGTINTVVNNESGCAEEITEFFGGSNVAPLELASTSQIHSVINCCGKTIHEAYGGSKSAYIIGNVVLDVKGGTIIEVYGGSKGCLNCGDGGTPIAANITGNVTLNLEGGTIATAFGGSNVNGNITGSITVNVIDFEQCPLDITDIFGGGNHANYEPTNSSINSPVVNVMHIKQQEGVKGNVFGGGNEAQVKANTRVNIGYLDQALPSDLPSEITPSTFHTFVTGNVFGGGNNAGVVGSTRVYVYNGEVCQSHGTAESVGIYGGCNTSGTVTHNSEVHLLGGTIGNSTTRANIHGGGFGSSTIVSGSVTVQFGEIVYDESSVEIHSPYPLLYGDLYGGSALGTVNTSNSHTTTVKILNGKITGIGTTGNEQYGNVFGGGLGSSSQAALVNGVVKVSIGQTTNDVNDDVTAFRGMADLVNCNVFGCNNKNGTPRDEVKVDVYKTNHIEGVNTVNGNGYAILAVFGGGNESAYDPDINNNPQARTHVYVHSCDNTIKYVYGGGNAANSYGMVTLVEGGRFDEIYGGGNGLDAPANIGLGGIGINVNAGHVNYLFEGSNHHGEFAEGAGINIPTPPSFPDAHIQCEGNLVIDSYFFGDNEAEHYGDLVGEITCAQAAQFNYKYVFAGSRWAIVYGDIKLTVNGGNIQYLFGGSKGYMTYNIPADVRRFPSFADLQADDELQENERKYSQDLRNHMGYPNNFKSELVGKGGNIVLTVRGGTIGDVIGGCDELGNVEGKITVIIDETAECPLVLGNVFGASNRTAYTPLNDATHHAYFNPATPNVDVVPTPQVKILKGTVGSDPVTFNVSGETLQMEGNVYGAGNIGDVTSNPKVIVGESSNTYDVEIKGNVFGGGKQGNVNGSAEVIVVPKKHQLTITQPNPATQGEIRVTDRQNNTVNSGTEIDEYQDLNVVAIPSAYGYKFVKWNVTNGSSVLLEASANTMFTMGTADAEISAQFATVECHTFTCNIEGSGSVAVTDGFGHSLTSNEIGEGAVLNLVATAGEGYAFLRWVVTDGNGTVANVDAATTTFTMGTVNTTIKAVFAQTHPLTFTNPANGTIEVYDIYDHAIVSGTQVAAGARLTIKGIHNEGYIFNGWTVNTGSLADPDSATTTYIMGNDEATLECSFILDE